MHSSTTVHLQAVKQILWYIKGTIDLGIHLKPCSSHIACLLRCKLGYVNSKSPSRILAFSTITTSMQLILLLIQYFHDHTEHIEVDYHFIHDLITTLKGQLVPIENQTTKIFTKGLVSSRFLLLRNKLVVHSISISFPADGDAVECFPDLLGCLD